MHQAYILKLSSIRNEKLIQDYSNYLYNHHIPDQMKSLDIHAAKFLEEYKDRIQPSIADMLHSRINTPHERISSDEQASNEHIQATESSSQNEIVEDSDLASTENVDESARKHEELKESDRIHDNCVSGTQYYKESLPVKKDSINITAEAHDHGNSVLEH